MNTRRQPGSYSLSQLSDESGLDRRTLAKLLVNVTSADGRFTLAHFADALLARSATAQARLDKLTAEAEIANQVASEGAERLVDVEVFAKEIEPLALESVNIIEASGLKDEEKDALRLKFAELFGKAGVR